MTAKNEKFRRLATQRVNKAIKQMELIGNLSNTRTYEFSETEAKQIFTALEKALKECKALFQKKPKKSPRMRVNLFDDK